MAEVVVEEQGTTAGIHLQSRRFNSPCLERENFEEGQ